MRDLGAEELRRAQRGLIGHHGQSLAFMRFKTPWMELARKLSKPVVVRQHAPLTGPFAVVDATTNYLHVLFNPLEQ